MIKILIGMPCMDSIPTQTVGALMGLIKPPETEVQFLANSLVYDARNRICQRAVSGGFTHLLFIDSDMIFPDDAIDRLLSLETDIATGVYYGRKGKHEPQVYKKVKPRGLFGTSGTAERITDPKGVFDIEACGMGLCLIKTACIKAVIDRYIAPFEPIKGLGEDFSFCYRAHKLGFKAKADARFEVGHIGQKIYTAADFIRGLDV